MAVETERKFLVKSEFRNLAVKKAEITQVYLASDKDKTIRLRIADDQAFLTIKGRSDARGISRAEWEFEIPVTDALDIIPLSLSGKIVKTRYYIPSGKHVFEVDEFHDKNQGLIIAEIELSYENEDFEKPTWLGEEVTGKAEYYNSNLRK